MHKTYLVAELKNKALYIHLQNDGNRPNTITPPLLRHLIHTLQQYCEQCHLVFLHGNSRNGFLAGDDIYEFEHMREQVAAKHFYDLWVELLHLLVTYPVPIICYVHNFTVGGGLGISCASDLVYADGQATFGLPIIHLNLSPAFIIPGLIKRVGFTTAMEMCYLGDTYSAQQAKTMGLINSVIDQEHFADMTDIVDNLAHLDRLVLMDIKRWASIFMQYDFHGLDPDSAKRSVNLLLSNQVQEAIQRFRTRHDQKYKVGHHE